MQVGDLSTDGATITPLAGLQQFWADPAAALTAPPAPVSRWKPLPCNWSRRSCRKPG